MRALAHVTASCLPQKKHGIIPKSSLACYEINLDISAILFRNFVQCPDLNSNFRVKDPYSYLINRSWISFVMLIST